MSNCITTNWYEDESDTEVRRATKEKMTTDTEEYTSRKKMKFNLKNDTEDVSSKPKKKPLELETDPSVLQRRQKQIDYGKNTVGYHNYTKQVPMDKRTKEDPKTPDKYTKYSRRSWDMLIKMWRKNLHQYDTDTNKKTNLESEDSDT